MADDTDEIPAPAAGGNEPTPVGWPLVERRRRDNTPPGGLDRRTIATGTGVLTLAAAALWPFRLAAVLGAVVRAEDSFSWHEWRLIVATIALSCYTAFVCVYPLPYRDDRTIRMRIIAEQLLNTGAVMLTGQWASPFVLFFVPTGMLAGFAAGGILSAEISIASVVTVSAQFVPDAGVRTAMQDGALWAGLLALVAFTSGLAHRAAYDAARQQQVALDRVSRLAEANSLLFSLQRVAQTLPASLDLDEVLDSTVSRLRSMVQHDVLVVYLLDEQHGVVDPVRIHGIADPPVYTLEQLPRGLRQAADSHKTVRLVELGAGDSVSGHARSGLYAALRARGALVGFIALEGANSDDFGQQQTEIVHGLTEPFGIAIDNARMFLRIRTLAADEERSRIARELHDHVGSSLALIGFEVDRAITVSADGGEVQPVLRELRDQVSLVVKDVRNTLFDLRTEVTDTRDLAATAAQFLQHVEQRSGMRTSNEMHLDERLPLMVERELWQIVKEAILNAERHSRGTLVSVRAKYTPHGLHVTVRDDGIGVDASRARLDSYGLTGMRERAARLEATLAVRSLPAGGTEVCVEIPNSGVPR